MATEQSNSPTITIPLADCPIGLLVGDAERDARYMSTLGLILREFPQVTVESYWRLTVAEHEFMLEAARGG